MAKQNDILNKLTLIKTDKRASNAVFDEDVKHGNESIIKIKIDKLKPTPANNDYFNDLEPGEYENLKDDIAKNGILTPLIIDTDFNILSGHQRYKIAGELNFETLPCIQREFKNEADKELFLVNDNLLRRHLTKEQKAVIIALLEKNIGIEIKQGQRMDLTSAEIAEVDKSITDKAFSEKLDNLKSNISERTLREGRAFINTATDTEIKDVIHGKAKIDDVKPKPPKITPAKKTKQLINIEIKNNSLIITEISGIKTELIKALETRFKMNVTEF